VVPIVFWGKRICEGREMNTFMGLLPSLEPDEGSATMSKVKTCPHYLSRSKTILSGANGDVPRASSDRGLARRLFS
jgi:hypothetical protein